MAGPPGRLRWPGRLHRPPTVRSGAGGGINPSNVPPTDSPKAQESCSPVSRVAGPCCGPAWHSWNGAPQGHPNVARRCLMIWAPVALEWIGRFRCSSMAQRSARNPDEPKRPPALGALLEKAGGQGAGGTVPAPRKGLDDHLATGGKLGAAGKGPQAGFLSHLNRCPARLRRPDGWRSAHGWAMPSPDPVA